MHRLPCDSNRNVLCSCRRSLESIVDTSLLVFCWLRDIHMDGSHWHWLWLNAWSCSKERSTVSHSSASIVRLRRLLAIQLLWDIPIILDHYYLCCFIFILWTRIRQITIRSMHRLMLELGALFPHLIAEIGPSLYLVAHNFVDLHNISCSCSFCRIVVGIIQVRLFYFNNFRFWGWTDLIRLLSHCFILLCQYLVIWTSLSLSICYWTLRIQSICLRVGQLWVVLRWCTLWGNQNCVYFARVQRQWVIQVIWYVGVQVFVLISLTKTYFPLRLNTLDQRVWILILIELQIFSLRWWAIWCSFHLTQVHSREDFLLQVEMVLAVDDHDVIGLSIMWSWLLLLWTKVVWRIGILPIVILSLVLALLLPVIVPLWLRILVGCCLTIKHWIHIFWRIVLISPINLVVHLRFILLSSACYFHLCYLRLRLLDHLLAHHHQHLLLLSIWWQLPLCKLLINSSEVTEQLLVCLFFLLLLPSLVGFVLFILVTH